MSQITPTPGRIIWFTPGNNDGITRNGAEPLAAIVAGVLADGTVNLAVFDARGNLSQRHAVEIVDADAANVPVNGFASWMPYQLGQAAKTERAIEIASIMTATAGVTAELATAMVQPAVVKTPTSEGN